MPTPGDRSRVSHRAVQETERDVVAAEARLAKVLEEEMMGIPAREEEEQQQQQQARQRVLQTGTVEQSWDTHSTRRQLSDQFRLHFKTPLHARLKLVRRAKNIGVSIDLMRQNFLQLFGLDLRDDQVQEALQDYCKAEEDGGGVDIGLMLEDLMGEDVGPSPLVRDEGDDASVRRPRRMGATISDDAPMRPTAAPPVIPDPVTAFEDRLRQRIVQGTKGIKQVYQVLSLLGGRPTCAELQSRLRAHFGVDVPGEVLTFLLAAYTAKPTSAHNGLSPRIAMLRYLQERILQTSEPPLTTTSLPAAASKTEADGRTPPIIAVAGEAEIAVTSSSSSSSPPSSGGPPSTVVLPSEARLQEALRWAIVRRVPGRAGLLRDACWLFGLGATGKISLARFDAVVRQTFLLRATPSEVEALWRRLGRRRAGTGSKVEKEEGAEREEEEAAVPIFDLLRRLMGEEDGVASQQQEVTQDLAWKRLLLTSQALRAVTKDQVSRLPLTGPRQMTVEEIMSLMALDIESRRRGLLSQLQYVSKVYDPAGAGLVTVWSLNQGLHRLGLELPPAEARLLFKHFLPKATVTGAQCNNHQQQQQQQQGIPIRHFLAHLLDPELVEDNKNNQHHNISLFVIPCQPSQPVPDPAVAAAQQPAPALHPSPPSIKKNNARSKPHKVVAASCKLPRPATEQQASAMNADVAPATESRAAAAVDPPLQPAPPPPTTGRRRSSVRKRQQQEQKAVPQVASVKRQSSGRGRLFTFRLKSLEKDSSDSREQSSRQVTSARK